MGANQTESGVGCNKRDGCFWMIIRLFGRKRNARPTDMNEKGAERSSRRVWGTEEKGKVTDIPKELQSPIPCTDSCMMSLFQVSFVHLQFCID